MPGTHVRGLLVGMALALLPLPLRAGGGPLPDGAVARLGPTRQPREGPDVGVPFVAFAGGHLLTAGGRCVHAWDATSGLHLFLLAEYDTAVQGLACSADGRLVASWGVNDGPCVRDAATGVAVRFLPAPPGAGPTFLAFAPDFQSIARRGPTPAPAPPSTCSTRRRASGPTSSASSTSPAASAGPSSRRTGAPWPTSCRSRPTSTSWT